MKKAGIIALSLFASIVSVFAQTADTPSPGWAHAMPPGPDPRVKITEEYAMLVARDVYFWAWPMVNMYNRRLALTPRATDWKPSAGRRSRIRPSAPGATFRGSALAHWAWATCC